MVLRCTSISIPGLRLDQLQQIWQPVHPLTLTVKGFKWKIFGKFLASKFYSEWMGLHVQSTQIGYIWTIKILHLLCIIGCEGSLLLQCVCLTFYILDIVVLLHKHFIKVWIYFWYCGCSWGCSWLHYYKLLTWMLMFTFNSKVPSYFSSFC